MTSAPPARRLWLVGYVFAAALRVGLVFAYPGGYDTQSYEMVVSIEERHGNVYSETTRYNYSPVWAGVLRALSRLATALGTSLDRAVLALLLLTDAATAWLLARIVRARGAPPLRAGLAALLFFANPISVLTSSRLAMFDNLSLLFLLVTVAAMETAPARKGGAVAAMSASLLVKHVTWFHPLLLYRRREPRVGWAGALAPYGLFLASFLPFWRSWDRIRQLVFGYQSL